MRKRKDMKKELANVCHKLVLNSLNLLTMTGVAIFMSIGIFSKNPYEYDGI